SFLGDCQLRYELYRDQATALVSRLERLEQECRGRELPHGIFEQLAALVSTLSGVPFARGVILEGAGYDPDPYLAAAPLPGGLTSVVIVSHDAIAKTRRCLEALRGAWDPAYPTEIVVVDNGSTDGSIAFLEKQPDVKLIATGENLGAPRARNRAIPVTRGDWIVFMDNDAVVTPGWLARLRYHADVDPVVGCVCPQSDRASHGQQIAYEGGDSFEAINAFADHLAGRQRRRARYGFLFSSFCVLVRRAVIDRIGGFDERFSPWGFEDDDFALRVQLSGFRVRVALDVFVRHETYSGPKLDRHEQLLLRNWRRFAEKWGEGRSVPEYGNYDLLAQTLERRWSDRELHVPLEAAIGG
ncbi:MAG: glycosyltransferase family 2 protein, partial [Myxococcota bacterium]